MKSRHLTQGMLVATIVGIAAMGCGKSASLRAGSGGLATQGGSPGAGGEPGVGGGVTGGMTGSGGQTGMGGYLGFGGSASGGSIGAGGTVGSGGAAGRIGAGGTVNRDGGSPDVPFDAGAVSSGGTIGMGGAKGGASGTTVGRGGSSGTGGVATGGSTGTGPVTIDCSAAMPANGVQHSERDQGTVGKLAWQLWENGTGATMTTFDTPAFRFTWGPSSGDALARLGLDFSDGGMTYDKYGKITAQFAENRSGAAGGFSYIGIYGFTSDPCVELYIVDDSYLEMPLVPYSTSAKGTVTIDGASYALYSGSVSGDTSSCRGSAWRQFYSVRQTARTCGQISISEHFDAWKAAGMTLGNLVELSVFAEVGGGTGSIDFPIANVMIEQ